MEFFEQNQMYVVLVVVLAIWFGFLGYMFKLDSKIKSLEEQLKK
ncbi:MAG: CcmD family protein [Bacteroidota bacterium]|nr:CcmD family protein [Bacteroidota bacterium]HAP35294.1 CcmD family protein [Bacteroidota bacterium]